MDTPEKDKEPKVIPIVALKLKTGEDIVSFYVGDMEMSFSNEKAIVLLRPMKITTMIVQAESGMETIYIPTLYFPLTNEAFAVPISSIVHQGVCNEFFIKLYVKYLPDLLKSEDERQRSIISKLERSEMEEIISKDSTIVYSDTIYSQ
jgi:hypothetical protein